MNINQIKETINIIEDLQSTVGNYKNISPELLGNLMLLKMRLEDFLK